MTTGNPEKPSQTNAQSGDLNGRGRLDRLKAAVAPHRKERWIAENAAALESSNAYVEQHGIPLSKYRNFSACRAGSDHAESADRRAEFNEAHKQWLDAQNSDFERNRLWSHGLVAWRDDN